MLLSNLILNASPASICVVRLSAIGDTCHALAVVRRLQDNWPKARITWIIGRVEAMLMSDIPDVEFIIFDKSKGRQGQKEVRDALRGRQFDVALCMHASLRINPLYRHIKAPVRLGYDFSRARDLQWLFTNQRIAATKRQHVLEAMMSFAETIGADARPIRWDIPLSDEDCEFAADYKSPNMPLVVISPCSSQRSRNYRDWSIDNYRTAIDHLAAKKCRVVLTGGKSEQESRYGAALGDHPCVDNLIAKTSLKQLAALIDAADLVICPDSGPAHMATAFGTPVLGLYATSNPDRTGPFASRELTVNRYPDAVARYLKKPVENLRWGQRVRHADAMQLITETDVKNRLDEFFDI